jgi:hypothetical protein
MDFLHHPRVVVPPPPLYFTHLDLIASSFIMLNLTVQVMQFAIAALLPGSQPYSRAVLQIRLWAGRGKRFLCTTESPDRRWGLLNLFTAYGAAFAGVQRSGRDVNHSPACGAEVKERVELYLYSPSRPSWLVLGWPLPLPFNFVPATLLCSNILPGPSFLNTL